MPYALIFHPKSVIGIKSKWPWWSKRISLFTSCSSLSAVNHSSICWAVQWLFSSQKNMHSLHFLPPTPTALCHQTTSSCDLSWTCDNMCQGLGSVITNEPSTSCPNFCCFYFPKTGFFHFKTFLSCSTGHSKGQRHGILAPMRWALCCWAMEVAGPYEREGLSVSLKGSLHLTPCFCVGKCFSLWMIRLIHKPDGI